MVSLPEIIGEIRGTGPKSKRVTIEVDRLVAALGPELAILFDIDLAGISRAGGSLLGEAITRLRRGDVIKEGGFDGEYGLIRLFRPEDLAGGEALFDLPAPATEPGHPDGPARPGIPLGAPPATDGAGDGSGSTAPREQPHVTAPSPGAAGTGTRAAPARVRLEEIADAGFLGGLDPDQRAAAAAPGPLMIIAGPGTGKTRTLTHRIAAGVAGDGVAPEACLALTFTRRAAQEMRDRLAVLLPAQAARLTITTFHGLGLAILREHGERAGLAPGFAVADDAARLAVAAEQAGSAAEGARLLAGMDREPALRAGFATALAARGLVDFAGLIDLPVALLRDEPAVAEALRQRWRYLSVDEYQDIDASQYALLRLLAGDGGGLTVIGDPDQAIYGFRGGDVGFFLRFGRDYPGARTVQLTRNYRSSAAIVSSAIAAVAPVTLVPGRSLSAVAGVPAQRAGTGSSRRRGSQHVPARITVHEAADEHAEAAWIAQAIDQVLGGVSLHSLDSGRADGHAGGKIGLADIAVLYRTDAQARPLGQALTRAGLPFQKRSHDLLARRTAVPDIVHEMRLAGVTVRGSVTGQLNAAVGRITARMPDGRAPKDGAVTGPGVGRRCPGGRRGSRTARSALWQ